MHLNTLYIKPLDELGKLSKSIIKEEIKILKNSKRKRLTRFVKGFKILSLFGKTSAAVLENFYFWARFFDDVIDKDRHHYLSGDLKFFIKQKKNLLNEMINNSTYSCLNVQDEADILLVYAHRLAATFKIDIMPFVLLIMETMEYDLLRSKIKDFPKAKELNDYFEKLDMTTIKATLAIIGETGIVAEDLRALNNSVRIYYTLRDLVDDIKNNIINISQEDSESYKINFDDLYSIKDFNEALCTESVSNWIFDQYKIQRYNLKKSDEILSTKKIQLKTKLALFICFKLPCLKWRNKLVSVS